MGSLLRLLERSPALRRRVIAALAVRQRLFGSLLAVHTGTGGGATHALAGFAHLALAIVATRPPANGSHRQAS